MKGLLNLDGPLMSWLSRMCDLLWLNILAMVCCIPIFTAGASITALYYMTMKMVKNEEGYITKGFFKSFKENFKQSTIIWAVMLGIMLLVWCDYRIFTYSNVEFPKALMIAFGVLILLCIITALYIFPLQARFVNSCKGTVKNAFLLGVTQLPKTVLMLIIYIAPILLVSFLPITVPLYIMFGISLPAYLSSYVLVSIFKILEANQEEREKQQEEKDSEGSDC